MGGGGGGSGGGSGGFAYFADWGLALGAESDELVMFAKEREFATVEDVDNPGEPVLNMIEFKARTGRPTPGGNGSGTGRSQMRFRSGWQTTPSPTLEALTGEPVVYRGMTYISADDAFAGDNVQGLPPYSAVVRHTSFARTLAQFPTWDSAKCNIIGANYPPPVNSSGGVMSANPAYALAHVLIWEGGLAAAKFDESNWKTAADTFYSEGFGISFATFGTATLRHFVEEVQRTCDCVVRLNRATGLIQLKLIREDYVEGNLSTITMESDCEDYEWARKSFDDIHTHALIKFKSLAETLKKSKFADRVQTLTLPGGQDQLGYYKPVEVDFSMLLGSDMAEIAIARQKFRWFYPLALGKFRCAKSKITGLNIGDPFKVAWTTIGGTSGNLIARVMAITGSTSADQRVDVEWAQDIFGVSNIDVEVITDPGGYTPPELELNDPPRFPFVADCLPEHNATQKAIFTLAVAPATGTTDAYQIGINGTSDDDKRLYPMRQKYCGTGLLMGAYGITNHIDRDGFIVDNTIGVAAVSHSSGGWQRMTNSTETLANAVVAIIASSSTTWEMIAFKTITDLGGGQFQLTDILRDIAGTGVRAHLDNTRVYFLPYAGNTMSALFHDVSAENLASSLALRFYATNFAGSINEYAEAGTASHTYGFRCETPYPPQTFTGTAGGGEVVLNWYCRKAHGGATNVNVDTNPSFWEDAPESGVVYRITGADGFGPVEVAPTTNPGATYTRTGSPAPTTYTIIALKGGRESTAVTVAA